MLKERNEMIYESHMEFLALLQLLERCSSPTQPLNFEP